MATIKKIYGSGNDSDFVDPADSDDDVYLDGGAGNDWLSVAHGNGALTMMGGSGNDTIDGRQGDGPLDDAGGSVLYGEIGDDLIYAAPLWGGDVQAYGGSGNDTIHANNFYNDVTISGGSGDDMYEIMWEDTSSYGITSVNLVETLANGTDTIKLTIEHDADFRMADHVENLVVDAIWWDNVSSNEFDVTNGTWEGAAGKGGGGYIVGNDLDNMITLSDRNDTSYGWLGGDTISGGVGHDVLYGEDGNDRLLGGRHNDTLEGHDGHDYLDGGTEADRLVGGAGIDTLLGGAGADTLLGGEDRDLLFGGTEADRLFGEGGDDSINGDAGNDTMAGGAGNDVYFVRDAGDVVTEALNNGVDRVETSLSTYVLSANVEDLTFLLHYGPSFTRYAVGNDLSNRIVATDGTYNDVHDSVQGAGGWDFLQLGTGNDTGFGGNDGDTIEGGAGNDLLRGDDGLDVLNGGDGNDSLDGGALEDTLQGGIGRDTLGGGTGHDSLAGGDGADILAGGTGNDTIGGGRGMDSIYGSAGADRLTGGLGADLFSYTSTADSNSATGVDTITDFQKGSDKINLLLDGDATQAGNQNFQPVGPFAAPGEVWFVNMNGGTMVYADIHGDAVADLQIFVANVAGVGNGDILW